MITGLASGPVPRETVKNALPVSGFTARSLIKMPLGVVPSRAAIFSSIFSTFSAWLGRTAGLVAGGDGVDRCACGVAHEQNSLGGKRGRAGRLQFRRALLHSGRQIGGMSDGDRNGRRQDNRQ